MRKLISRYKIQFIDLNKSVRRRNDRLLFFDMPRAASASVNALCKKYGVETHSHNRRGSYILLKDRGDINSRFVFAIVRNPFTRFLSSYHWLRSGGQNNLDKKDRDYFFREQDYDLNEFVERWVHQNSPLLKQAHFTLMSEYLCHDDGSVIPEFVVRFEDLQEKQRALCNLIGAEEFEIFHRHKSATPAENLFEALSESSRLQIFEVYKRDFLLWYPSGGDKI